MGICVTRVADPDLYFEKAGSGSSLNIMIQIHLKSTFNIRIDSSYYEELLSEIVLSYAKRKELRVQFIRSGSGFSPRSETAFLEG